MKILHVDNLNLLKYGAVYYAFDRKISNGLIRNGHYVYDFSYRDTARCATPFQSKHLGTARMNQRLLETAANIRPDFLLLGNAEIVSADTLRRIRKMLPAIRIALWYVDWIIPEVDTRSIFDRLEVIDTLFLTTGGELPQRYQRDNNTVAYLPNAVDSSIETLANHQQQDFETDLLFCGTDKGDPQRAGFLRELRERLSGLCITYHGSLGAPAVFGDQYLQALARSKMGLNLSRRSDVYRYSSDRIAQLTGNGLLTFTQDTPGMRDQLAVADLRYLRAAEPGEGRSCLPRRAGTGVERRFHAEGTGRREGRAAELAPAVAGAGFGRRAGAGEQPVP